MTRRDNNIVKKVFERVSQQGEKISPLFTYTKRSSKVLAAESGRGGGSLHRLPAAVDLGNSSVKIVQLVQRSKDDFEIAVLDEESLLSGPIEALKKLVGRNRVGPEAVVGLSAKESRIFHFGFPAMSTAELEEAIGWKMKQARPFGLEPEKLKYAYVLGESSAAAGLPAQQFVTVVCAPLETLQKKVEWLAQAGLKTVAIQSSPLSAANLQRTKNPPSQSGDVTLWLDLGAEESVMGVQKAGTVCFVKNLEVTSAQLTRQLAQTHRLDLGAAERLKKLHGLNFWSPEKTPSTFETVSFGKKEDEPAVVFYSLISLLENFVIDIELSFKNFCSQAGVMAISQFDRVFLIGGGAQLEKLDLFLQTRLGVPVERVNARAGLKFSCNFAPGVGLALDPALLATGRINLLPGPEKKTPAKSFKSLKSTPVTAGVLLVALAAMVFIPPAVQVQACRVKADALEAVVKKAKDTLNRDQSEQLQLAEEETDLLEAHKVLETKRALLEASGGADRQFAPVLATFADLLPEAMWVTQLSYKEKKITVVGLTLESDLIVAFINELKKSELFRDITFNYAQKEPSSSVYRFQVVMGVRLHG